MSRRIIRRLDGPFAAVPCDVLTSEAVRTLPNLPFRVLVAIAAQYHGARNGSLTFTRKTARQFGIGDSHGLGASLRELEERGLILCTRRGTRVPPRSAMYAVTWFQIDEPLRHDAHDATPTLKPSHVYGGWKASRQGQHWTARRRKPRWDVPTSAGGACPQVKAEMSGACPQGNAVLRVAHAHYSQISGVEEAA